MKKIWNIITTVIVIFAILLAVLLVGVRLIGLQAYTVLSGSMEPEYPVGSLIYVKEAKEQDLKVGDVISFMVDENTIATHRIVELVPDENDPDLIRYRTKGDANDTNDADPVHYNNVLGRAEFHIPYLGYVANYIQNPPGMYVSIAVGCILVILVFIPDLFSKKEGK